MIQQGEHCVISAKARIGENVRIGHNVIIEEGVTVGDNCLIDHNTVLRKGVSLGEGSLIGANCILGEYGLDIRSHPEAAGQPLEIGREALIRSGSILYGGSRMGDCFQTGHQVTVREGTEIGSHVSVGTLSDIQGHCRLGNYVRLHSNVHVGQLSRVDDFVWIYPYVVLTNDPTPPSNDFVGVHVQAFAIIATGTIVMAGLELGHDCLIGAGAIVTKPVAPYAVAVGNPARTISDVRRVRNKITGEPAYPWREHFSNHMPWDEAGFAAWYAGLDLTEKERYTVPELGESELPGEEKQEAGPAD